MTRSFASSARTSSSRRPIPKTGNFLPRTLLLLSGSRLGRPHSHDLQQAFAILGAVVMDLLAEVSDEAACWNGLGAGRIVVRAGPNPPRSRDHGDEPVIGVGMRHAHVPGRPLGKDDVQTGFRRIA